MIQLKRKRCFPAQVLDWSESGKAKVFKFLVLRALDWDNLGMTDEIPVLHLLVLLTLACLTNKTWAAEPLSFGAINVAPYAVIENQTPNGLYVEFINQLAALSEVAFSIDVVPFARAKEGFISNTYQTTMMFESPDLNAAGVQICSPVQLPSVLFYVGDKVIPIEKLTDGLISRMRNGCKDFENYNNKKIQFIEANTIQIGISQVKSERSSAFCAEYVSLDEELKKGSIPKSKTQFQLISSRKVVLYANKNLAKKTISVLKTSCKKLIESGNYRLKGLTKDFLKLSNANRAKTK